MRTLRHVGSLVLVAGTLSGCTAALTAASVAVGVVQIAQEAARSSSGGVAGAKQQPSLFSWLSKFTAPKKQLAQLDRSPSELCLSRIPQQRPGEAKMSLASLATPAKPAPGAAGGSVVSTTYVVPDGQRPASSCELRLVCLPNASHPAPMWVCPNGEVSPEAPADGQTATTLGSGNPTAWAWSATQPRVAAPRTTTATASSVTGTEGTGVAAASGATPIAAATAPSAQADGTLSGAIPIVERGTRVAGKLRAQAAADRPADASGAVPADGSSAGDGSADSGQPAAATADTAFDIPLVERGSRVAGKVRTAASDAATEGSAPDGESRRLTE